MPIPPARHLSLVALVVALAGCNGSLTMSQRLAGEWRGRPETAAERTVREWPTGASDPDDPEIAEAVRKSLPTDLEAAAGTVVTMRLTDDSAATLSLAGEESLSGKWSVLPLEGRRAQLEIEVDKASEETAAERRRFEIEFLPEGEAFVLREAGADRRFGRLLFERKGAPAAPAN